MPSAAEVYTVLPTATPTAYRTAVNGGDSADLATVLAGGSWRLDVESNPNVSVSCRFATASATAVVTCVRYHSDRASSPTYTMIGKTNITSVAEGTYRDASAGNYVADDIVFDAGAATHVEIRVADPSTGAVELFVTVFGADTKVPTGVA